MRAWLAPIALGVSIAFLALVAVLILRPGSPPTAVERADRLAAELRCPDCQGLSVADSPTAAAREIRRQIDELVAGGATDAEVRTHFVDRYGDWILLAPRPGIVWLLPWAVAAAAIVGLGILVVRRRSTAEAAGPARADVTEVDARGADARGADARGADARGADARGADARRTERRRVRDEAEALDA